MRVRWQFWEKLSPSGSAGRALKLGESDNRLFPVCLKHAGPLPDAARVQHCAAIFRRDKKYITQRPRCVICDFALCRESNHATKRCKNYEPMSTCESAGCRSAVAFNFENSNHVFDHTVRFG